MKYTKANVKEGTEPKGFKSVDLGIPMLGYSKRTSLSGEQARRAAHIGIDRAHGRFRTSDASAANAHDGAQLPEPISKQNTDSAVWADTA